ERCSSASTEQDKKFGKDLPRTFVTSTSFSPTPTIAWRVKKAKSSRQNVRRERVFSYVMNSLSGLPTRLLKSTKPTSSTALDKMEIASSGSKPVCSFSC